MCNYYTKRLQKNVTFLTEKSLLKDFSVNTLYIIKPRSVGGIYFRRKRFRPTVLTDFSLKKKNRELFFLMKYDLYSFDFDLTMADTVSASMEIYRRAYRAVGKTFPEEEIYLHLGMPIETTFYGLFPQGSSETYDRFMSAFNKAIEDTFTSVTLYPDVLEYFRLLKQNDKKIAVITNRRRDAMEIIQKIYPELNGLIDLYVTGDDTKKRKPNPDPILLCLNRLNVRPENAVYVGDAQNDFLAAKNAGVKFYFVDRTGHVTEKGAVKTFFELD